MSRIARRQYLMAILERYPKSRKKEKAIILNEYCAVCGFHKKIRYQTSKQTHLYSKKVPGAPRCYGKEVLVHLNFPPCGARAAMASKYIDESHRPEI